MGILRVKQIVNKTSTEISRAHTVFKKHTSGEDGNGVVVKKIDGFGSRFSPYTKDYTVARFNLMVHGVGKHTIATAVGLFICAPAVSIIGGIAFIVGLYQTVG